MRRESMTKRVSNTARIAVQAHPTPTPTLPPVVHFNQFGCAPVRISKELRMCGLTPVIWRRRLLQH